MKPALFCAMAALLMICPSGANSGEPEARRPSDSPPSETPEPVTWPELVKRIDAHPLIAASRHEQAAALATVETARAVPNPELSGSAAAGLPRDRSAEPRLEWGLSLSMPLDWLAERGGKTDAARAEAARSKAEAEALRRELRLTLGTAFWSLVAAQERLAVLEEMQRQTQTLLKTVTRRVEMGDARPVETTRIAVEMEKIVGELDVARATLHGNRAALNVWLDRPLDRPVVALADLDALPVPPSVDAAVAAMQQDHPAMMAEAARLRALAQAVAVEKRKRMPALSMELFTDHELDRHAYGGGVSIDLPLWNQNRGAINASKRRLAAGQQQMAATRLSLTSITIATQTRCREGVIRATQYRDKILPNATSAADTIERTYELGEAPLLDVIDARRTLVETKRAYLEALVDAQTHCHRLRVLIGKD